MRGFMRQRTHRHEVGDSVLLMAAATTDNRNNHSNSNSNSNNNSGISSESSSSSSLAPLSAVQSLEKTLAAATASKNNKNQTASVRRLQAPGAQPLSNALSSSSVLMQLDVNRQPPSMHSKHQRNNHNSTNSSTSSISSMVVRAAPGTTKVVVPDSRGTSRPRIAAAKRKPTAQDSCFMSGGGGGSGGGTLAALPAPPPMKQAMQCSVQQRPSSSSSTIREGEDILLSMDDLCLEDHHASSTATSTTAACPRHTNDASTAALHHNTFNKKTSRVQETTPQLAGGGLIDFALGAESFKRGKVGPPRDVVLQNQSRISKKLPLKSSSSTASAAAVSSVNSKESQQQPRQKTAVNVRQALRQGDKQFNRSLHAKAGGGASINHGWSSHSDLEGSGGLMSTILSIGASPARMIRGVTRKRTERTDTMSSLVAATNNNNYNNHTSNKDSSTTNTASPQPMLAWSRRRAVDFNQVFSPTIVRAVKRVDLKKTPVRLASVLEGNRLQYQSQQQQQQSPSLLLDGADFSSSVEEQGHEAPCRRADDLLDPLTNLSHGSPRRKDVVEADAIRLGGNGGKLNQSLALVCMEAEIPQGTVTDGSSHLESTADDPMVVVTAGKKSTQTVDADINVRGGDSFSLEPDADDQMDIDPVPPALPPNLELKSITESPDNGSASNGAEAMESFILNDDDDVESIDTTQSLSSGIEMQDCLITEIEAAEPRRSSVMHTVPSSEKNITQSATMLPMENNDQVNVHDTCDEVMGEAVSEDKTTAANESLVSESVFVAHAPKTSNNSTSSPSHDTVDNAMSNISESLACDDTNNQKSADASRPVRRSRRSREKTVFLGVFADDNKVARRSKNNKKQPPDTSTAEVLDGRDDSVLLGTENNLDSASTENEANAAPAPSMRRRSLRIRKSQEARIETATVATVERQPPKSNARNKAQADSCSEEEGQISMEMSHETNSSSLSRRRRSLRIRKSQEARIETAAVATVKRQPPKSKARNFQAYDSSEEEEQTIVEMLHETNSSSARSSPKSTTSTRGLAVLKAANELSSRVTSARPRPETTVAKCQQEAMLHDGLPKPESGAGRVVAARQQQEFSTEPSGTEWSEKQIRQLRVAHGRVNPLSRCFWADIAKRVENKNALQCRKKWFSLVKTPQRVRARASKVAVAKKKADDEVKSRDLFKSSPIRNTTSLSLSVDFGSGIKVNSSECRDGFFDAFVESGELNGCLHTSSPKAGYKTFVQGLKRDVRRPKDKNASQAKASSNNKAPAQQHRVLKQSVQHGAVGLNGILTPGGSLVMRKKSLLKHHQFDEDDDSADEMMSDGWESEEDDE